MHLNNKYKYSYEMLIFISKALESYRNKYTKISEQALAKKIGVSVYFLSKFNSEKIKEFDLAKIDILNLWNLINFFKDRNVMDLDVKNEFKKKLEKFLAFEFNIPKQVELEGQANRDESSWEKELKKNDSISVCNDLDSCIVYNLCIAREQDGLFLSMEDLFEIFGKSRTEEILNHLESQGIIALKENIVKLAFQEYALNEWVFKNFLSEIPMRFFNHNDKGKGRMASGFFIGSLNKKGLAKLYSLTARYLNEAFGLFKSQKYGGKIPVACSSFMNAMIRNIHQENLKKGDRK